MTGEALIIEVSTSRKAMPILTYLAAFVLSILYLTDVATAASLASTTDNASATLWQTVLLAASTLALVAVALPRRQLTRALVLESVAAGILSIELYAYVWVLAFSPSTSSPPWATIIWLGLPICTGLGLRSINAMSDRKRRLLALKASGHDG